MAITLEDLKKLIEVKSKIEKITTLSFDGKNLLTRVPKDIMEYLELEKGDKIRWVVDSDKKMMIESIK
jgi:antitoxin component of MazEF toxin-antitoxin module